MSQRCKSKGMSALGQKQTSVHVRAMSALHPRADIDDVGRDVRFVPKADMQIISASGPGKVSVDRLFAQCLACFEPMQTFYEDEAITIRPNQDGHLLSDFKHTLGDLLNNFWFEGCAAFYRHVDVCDRKFFSPHHGASPKCANEKSCQSRTVSKTLFQLAAPIKPIGQKL
jgi:hypothetical protein